MPGNGLKFCTLDFLSGASLQLTGPDILAASWLRQGNSSAPQGVESLKRALVGWTFVSGDGWMLGASRAECLASFEDTHIAMTGGFVFDRNRSRLLEIKQVAVRIATDLTSQESFAAPYRLLKVDLKSSKVEAWFDDCGLGHVFTAKLADVDIYSNSARLLARLAGASPDRRALAAFSQLGLFPFETTPFEGVTKLLPRDPLASYSAQDRSAVSARQTVEALREAMRCTVSAMLEAAPDAEIELSGGLDSRMILAAMEPQARANRIALTLFDPAGQSADLRIADQIAQKYGMRHRVRTLDSTCLSDPDRLFGLLDKASSIYECMGNPVDKVPLLDANLGESGGARFAGQNGEILRGFFHSLQPLGEAASPQLVERLVAWRLVANDRVSADLFLGGNTSREIVSAMTDFRDRLSAFGGNWGQALDRIYLRLRMQAWAGNAASANLYRRTMFLPFFDRKFLEIAMAIPARQKSDSVAAYQLLDALDPSLSSLPLDNGIVPAKRAQQGPVRALSLLTSKAGKLAQRIGQRMTGSSGEALGGPSVVKAWHRFDGHLRLDLDGLDRLGIFEPSALERISRGEMLQNRADLGYILLCDAVVRN